MKKNCESNRIRLRHSEINFFFFKFSFLRHAIIEGAYDDFNLKGRKTITIQQLSEYVSSQIEFVPVTKSKFTQSIGFFSIVMLIL